MFLCPMLVFLAAVTSAQQAAPCRCGVFITTEVGEELLYELPPVDVHNCDQHHPCQNRCFEEFEELSGGGDLGFEIVSDNATTVGGFLCQEAGGPVEKKFVYAYSELCDGPWEWTGDQSLQPLCCDEASEYYPCEGVKSEYYW